jgi:DNA gyrase/topoisomerase IV subunit A
MAKDILTDAQVELEIDRLMNSKAVKLAKKEAQIKYKRRQYMYQLRNMEKRGKQLEAQGITLENIDKMIAAIPVDEDEE